MRAVIVGLAFLGALGYAGWQLASGALHAFGMRGALIFGAAVATLAVVWWKRWGQGVSACQAKRREAEDARNSADFERAERLLREGLEMAKQVDAGANLAVLHWDLANLYGELQRYEEAIVEVRAALAAANGNGSPYARQIRECGPGFLAELLANQGKWAELEEILQAEVQQSTGIEKAHSLQNLASVLLNQEKADESVQCAQRAAEITRKAADDGSHLHGRALRMLGAVAIDAQRADVAMATYSELRSWAAEFTGPATEKTGWEVTATQGLGHAHLALGELEEAERLLEWSAAKSREFHAGEMEAECLLHLAETLLQMSQFERAKIHAEQALQYWEQQDPPKAGRVRRLLDRIGKGAELACRS